MTIRPMCCDDIDFVLRATNDEGWSYSREEIERVLSLSHGRSFIWEDSAPRGLVSSISYSSTAVIGHLLVRPEYRGRGIGTELLYHVLSELDSQAVESVIVFSTDDGVELYKTAGFSSGPKVISYGMIVTGEVFESSKAISLEAADLDVIIDMDHEIFGDSRRELIENLYSTNPELCMKVMDSGQICGYIFARRTPLGGDIGPWVCRPAEAKTLIDAILPSMAGSRIDMGHFQKDHDMQSILGRNRPVKNFEVRLMTRGAPRYAGNLKNVFGIAGFELG